jgi:hypothetical protein
MLNQASTTLKCNYFDDLTQVKFKTCYYKI